MAALGLHDLLVRWNPYRGWWIGNGFGVNLSPEFFPTRYEAVRAAHARLGRGAGRVLVEVGVHQYVTPLPSDLADRSTSGADALPGSARASRRSRSRAPSAQPQQGQ